MANEVTESASLSLYVVSDELNATLRKAQIALEDAIERGGARDALSRSAKYLHEMRGVLQMVEVYGAALLTEEMEAVAEYLASFKPGAKGQEDGLDALARAMVQLPPYLQRIVSGGRDIALVLLPLLNDLRAVRGRPLLSESTLLLLNGGRSSNRSIPKPKPNGENIDTLIAKARPAFQLALLGWIKGQRAEEHLAKLARVASSIEDAAPNEAIHQLWWVVGAVLEALRDGTLDTSVALKRLLGQADRELRRITDVGVEAYSADPPASLLNNLLYYVARARSESGRVADVRRAFNLLEMLPGDKQVEDARAGLSAPSPDLMKTVAGVMKEDLAQVKDVLDIYVRTGGENEAELAPQLEMLKKISDTLGVLGLGDLRGDIQGEVARLGRLIENPNQLDDAALIQVAATLLAVEDNLDQQLTQLVAPQGSQDDIGDGAHERTTIEDSREQVDYQQVTHAVVRECLINLARLKEGITRIANNSDDRIGIDNAEALMRGVRSGLLMLGKDRAMDVTARLDAFVDRALRRAREPLEPAHYDRLADALVSLEYYLETIQVGRRDPWYMLDNAEGCLDYLESIEFGQTEQQQAGGTEKLNVDEIDAAFAAKEAGAGAAITEVLGAPDHTGVDQLPVVSEQVEHVDPELLELFIEESREEVESIEAHLPKWLEDPEDLESLITVRRSFHTLKGSGRMVGAERIGEYCWAVEDLLNRLINRTVTRNPPMLGFIQQAAAVVPDLIEEIEVGTPPPQDVASYMAKASAFAEGDPNAAAMQTEAAPAQVAAEMEPELYEIFAKETGGHLDAIRAFLGGARAAQTPQPVSDALYRACHTLHGSVTMANLDRAHGLTHALNRLVRRHAESDRPLAVEALSSIDEAVEEMERIVATINQNDAGQQTPQSLIEKLNAQTDGLTVTELDAVDLDIGSPDTVDFSPADGAEPPLAAISAETFEYDPEIAAIFTEEATEILEATDESLQAYSTDPSRSEPLLELKRHLHTLKGGARMAGIQPMGDVSHELEALLIALEEERAEPNAETLQLLQSSVDELHRMRDSVVAGQELSQPVALLAALRGEEPAIADDEAEPAAAALAVEEGQDRLEIEAPESQDPPLDLEITIQPDETAAVEILSADAMAGIAAENDNAIGETDAPSKIAEPDADSTTDETWIGPTADIESYGEIRLDADDSELSVESATDNAAFADVQEDAELSVLDEADAEPDLSSTIISATGSFATEEGAEALEALMDAGSESLRLQALDTTDEPLPISDEPAVQTELPRAESSSAEFSGFDDDDDEDDDEDDDFGATQTPLPSPDEFNIPQPDPVSNDRGDVVRVDAEILESLLNAAGEISIFHSRLAQQVSLVDFNLTELEQTVSRLRGQLRKLEIETEAQILHRHQEEQQSPDFDPLELDRYSVIQQLSRALAESANDVGSIKDLLQSLTSDADTLLVQQARVTAELQDGLMRTRMIPFSKHVGRLTRVVRQSAAEVSKQVELDIEGASGELDRQVLEKMLPPFEHMLRNAVIHGVEDAAARRDAGKPALGRISVRLRREGSEMVIDVSDDGSGLDLQMIRAKALELGLIAAEDILTDAETMELILAPGFSTAGALTQSAGRGVGMDIVANEIKKLGGSLGIGSIPGQGTNFTIRLPFTLAITQALIVRTGDEIYALPLPSVEGVARVPRQEIDALLSSNEQLFDYGERAYRIHHLGTAVDGPQTVLPDDDQPVPLILVRKGDSAIALLVDELMTSREIVVKSVGPQLAVVRGVSGATILGDGRVVLILDPAALIAARRFRDEAGVAEPQVQRVADERPLVLVVDDSITVRRVTERFLQRHGMRSATARDGIDAIARLEDEPPDVILLDIEMPRMDGYEFATHVRNDDRFRDTPIIMITSRVSEKHKARAIEIGVNDYLGKPYQDHQLLDTIDQYLPRKDVK